MTEGSQPRQRATTPSSAAMVRAAWAMPRYCWVRGREEEDVDAEEPEEPAVAVDVEEAERGARAVVV